MREKGYYWVKFYNHIDSRIMFWNGDRFEAFKSDFVHDEIESINESCIEREDEQAVGSGREPLEWLDRYSSRTEKKN